MKRIMQAAIAVCALLMAASPMQAAEKSTDDTVSTEALYQAYGTLVKQYEEKYGTLGSVMPDQETPWLTGLCFLELVDFNRDGTEELLLVHEETITENGYSWHDYAFEVWAYGDGKIRRVDTGALRGYNGGLQEISLVEHGGQTYLLTGGADSFEYDYYHGFDKDGFGVVHSAECEDYYEGGQPYLLDGTEVSREQWEADVAEWSGTVLERYNMCYNFEDRLDAAVQMTEATRALLLPGETAQTENQAAAQSGEYLIADSNIRNLTEADILGTSPAEIQQIINEIYARHGRVFTLEENDTYFRSKSWYQPVAGKTDEQILMEFNQYEKYNVDFLARYLTTGGPQSGAH